MMEEYEDDVMDEPHFSDDEAGYINLGEEAEEDNSHNLEDGGEIKKPKPEKVKRPVQNPQPKLNLQALQGSKGLLALNEQFSTFKFRGTGHELEDLSEVLKGLEQWAFRLFPKFHFEDSLKRLEALGKKREIQVYLKKIRNGMITNDDVVRQVDDDDPEDILEDIPAKSADAFDEMLSQQVARTQVDLSEEQRIRIERNKQLAMEKRRQKELSVLTSEPSPMDLDALLPEPSVSNVLESMNADVEL